MRRVHTHWRSIWLHDYVAQPAPRARSGSGMYSQQLEQNQYSSSICAPNPSAHLTVRTGNPTLSLLRPFSATVESASFFQKVPCTIRLGGIHRNQGVEAVLPSFFDTF